jgi:hypothetical protein
LGRASPSPCPALVRIMENTNIQPGGAHVVDATTRTKTSSIASLTVGL